ncbi:MAG: hypothetical protein SVV80_08715 [Planctomycetota bacterium]|nr:hypothetical protein [Planctomycetota bacterium]
MPDRAILREHFNAMLQTTSDAAAEYDRLAKEATDADQREQLLRLTREKYRYVELTERLLEILDE